jgi:hypothetical protein
MALRLGLLPKALGEHGTGQGIAHLSRLLLDLNELRSPGRIPLGPVKFLPQLCRQRLDPIL